MNPRPTRPNGRSSDSSRYIAALPEPDESFIKYADEFMAGVESLPTYRPTIGCVIPAYNEEDSIAEVLESLLAQTRLPDAIHVIVNNTTDGTVRAAGEYAGRHERTDRDGVEQATEIFVHDIGENPDKKVGALNYGFFLVEGYDYLLGVDGDTSADEDAIERLAEEMMSDDRIGGISAIYSIDDATIRGGISGLLIAGQRAQFAAFNMQNLLRGRNMSVLGGQYSIFAIAALRDVMEESRQRGPWVRDSEIEDSLLSLQIKSAGYLTKISARARAYVGGMTTLRSLDAQQVKWNTGAIDLMWPGQRGDTRGQPLHPNLRLRWFEHISMGFNLVTRLMFAVLLAASISIHALVFYPWWLLPPIIATLLNLRVARSMKNVNGRDMFFAATYIPSELYMWVRIGHFIRAWSKFASRSQGDNWAAQARAEKGAGNAYLAPVIGTLVTLGVLAAIWVQLSTSVQSNILAVGWPILGIITVVQTGFMTLKLFRRYKGFTV